MNYDGLRRLSSVGAGVVSKNYTYRDISSTQTTTQVSMLRYPNAGSGINFGYTYDASGNIATYTAPDGEVITYTYDGQGQLLKAEGDQTYTYIYDDAGNILTGNGHTYTYGDSTWKDLLTAFDNGTISYDKSGNPTSYYNGTRWTMSWENGRQLVSAATISDTEDVTVTCVYDMNGVRVSKTVTASTYAHVHSYAATVVPPTCMEDGYTVYEFDCGDRYQGDEVAALGHDYSESRSGEYITYTCSRCAYTYTEHDHSFTTTVVDPTCTEDGYTLYQCACGYSYQEVIRALGHDCIETTNPKTGKVTRRCTRCAYSYETDPLPLPVEPGPPIEVASYSDGGTNAATTNEAEAATRVLVSTVTEQHDYIYASGKLLRETVTTTEGDTSSTQILDFFYDASGTPYALKTNGTTYYYVANLQGDVMQLVNSSGTAVASYEYDPYGNIVSQSGDMAEINPLRYRSYYFDSESSLYYLQSRYYDPEIGRFINADGYASTGQSLLGYNMFAYCGNNPIMGYDPTGSINWWGVAAGVGVGVLAVLAVAATVATAGTASPLVAAVGTSVGTTISAALVEASVVTTVGAAAEVPVVYDVTIVQGYTRTGASLVYDFGENTSDMYLHKGKQTGEDLSVTFGSGFVFNYDEPGDYAGEFLDVST